MSEAPANPHYSARGGGRIGWVNATWPFAKLTVMSDRFLLSVGLLGEYSFAPADIVSLERVGSIPFFNTGVQVVHRRTDYPERIIFWCVGSPEEVLRCIREVGFSAAATPASASTGDKPRSRGFALHWWAMVIPVVIWNVLFTVGVFWKGRVDPTPGPFHLAALAFAFCLSVSLLRSERLQGRMLKPGRSVGEIQPFLILLAVITALMTLVMTLAMVSGGFNATTLR